MQNPYYLLLYMQIPADHETKARDLHDDLQCHRDGRGKHTTSQGKQEAPITDEEAGGTMLPGAGLQLSDIEHLNFRLDPFDQRILESVKLLPTLRNDAVRISAFRVLEQLQSKPARVIALIQVCVPYTCTQQFPVLSWKPRLIVTWCFIPET